MLAAEFSHPQPLVGVPEWFPGDDVTPLAGRVARAGEFDEAAAAALANAIVGAFGGHAPRAGTDSLAVAVARFNIRSVLGLVAIRTRVDAPPATAPVPIKTPAGWRSG